MDIEKFNRKIPKFKKLGKIKECFHSNHQECNGKIKQAHSIQRNGKISLIESEVNGNLSVYTFTNFKSSEKSVIETLVPLGKKVASTFYGFCDFHDSSLFSDIENFETDIDKEKHLFLHTYRSFAHSYHKKKEELNLWSEEFEKSEFNSKSGFSQFMRSKMEHDCKIALEELNSKKQILDDILESKTYSKLEYLVYQKEGLYPFAVSSQMSPKVTYKGSPMNNHEDANIPYENPIITLLPDIKHTTAIIGIFPLEKKSSKLLNELENLNDLKLERAITSLIIANCENTFFSPLFWEKLNKKSQRKLIDEFIDNTSTSKYLNKWFNSSFNFFDDKYEIEI
ncbi:hypothetical protein [Tenacibaculum halocynthiae]|uniref:hypothetical protein n=1 Tax=Tenacibaculum halocynthiae TaxID=1254437 RepID=UPI0038961645